MIITETALKEGIKKCLANAADLMSDASLLKDNGRRERAYSLYQLASEETGKAIQILEFITSENINDPNSQKLFLKKFLDHRENKKLNFC